MPITSITKNPESLTMTVVADFGVPVQRLWDAYADPRQLGGSGDRRPTRRDSPGMTCGPAVAVTTP